MSVIIVILMYMIAILIIINTLYNTIVMLEEILLRIKEIEEAASERILIMTKQWGANVHFMRLWIKYLDVLEVREKRMEWDILKDTYFLTSFLPYCPSYLLTYLLPFFLTYFFFSHLPDYILSHSSSFISITLLSKLPLSAFTY